MISGQVKTGYVYDPVFLKHTKYGHPENEERLKVVMQELGNSGLMDGLTKIPAREATLMEIMLGHTEDYINSVKFACLNGINHLDMDTYINSNSYDVAIRAVGGTIDLTRDVINGKLNNGFALVRPPGHHALSFRAMGFCIFNNVAIAAKMAISNPDIKRVGIVDFDVHHGNGTQAILENNPDILYISTHQFPYYPGTGNYTEIGSDKGIGATMNLPLIQGVGDDGFKNIYHTLVLPVLRKFNPQLILVSAGYDAHWADPLAGLGLSLEGYSWISKTLVELADEICDGKIIFVLEGGYHLDVLKNGVANSIRALLHLDKFVDPLGKTSYKEPEIHEYIKQMKSFFK